MANDVFANGREINCKKGSGKSICAFPDVCWTPPDKVPPTPTGVPVPYPNTGMASDCTKGSKKVKVSGKEVLLKNSSHFKKSMGDEAGVAQLKGLVTMKNRGKIYFQMWSMDVKIEGKNVVRHLDIGTHNHGSQIGNTPPWPFLDSMALIPVGLNPTEQKHAEECVRVHEHYKEQQKAAQNHRKDERISLKSKIRNDTATADEETEYLAIELQRVEFLEKELEGRKKYVEKDCDKIDWEGSPHDATERKRRHEVAISGLDNQVRNVINLKGI